MKMFSQGIIDTIITSNSDTIPCQITYVNNYSAFYKIKKRKKLKSKITPRIDIYKLIINTEGVTILEEKFDSGINDYFRKSKLDRKYETLLLTEHTDPSLKVLADSTFSTSKTDYLYLATMIQAFANRYNCKLIYHVVSPDSRKFRIRLYDASDAYYHQVLNSYKLNKIYFVRTDNKLDYSEISFKINAKKVVLNKNEYLEYTLSEKDSTLFLKKRGLSSTKKIVFEENQSNAYIYIGKTDYYIDDSGLLIGVLGGAIGGAIAGSAEGVIGGIIVGSVVSDLSSGKSGLNNFIGEFVRLYTHKKTLTKAQQNI